MKSIYAAFFIFLFTNPVFSQSWSKVDLPFNNCFVLGETKGNLIVGGDCIYYSKDGEHFANGIPGNWLGSYQMATYKNSAFAALDFGLRKSDDGGKTWNTVLANTTKFVVNLNDTLYCGNRELFRSTDGGNTWTKIVDGICHQSYCWIKNIYIIRNKIYFHLSNMDLYSSFKDGADTAKISTGVIQFHSSEKFGGRFFAFMYGGNNPNRFAYSDDLGETWEYKDSLPNYILDFSMDDSLIYAGTDNGIYCTDPFNISWRQKFNVGGYTSNLFFIRNNIYLQNDKCLKRSTDGGLTWEKLYKGIDYYYYSEKPLFLAGTKTFNVCDYGYRNISKDTFTKGGIGLQGFYAWMGEACGKVFTYMQSPNHYYTGDGVHWKKYDVPSYPGTVRKVVGNKGKVYISCYNPGYEGYEKLGWSNPDSVYWTDFPLPSGFSFRRVESSDDFLFLQGIQSGAKVLKYSLDTGKTWVTNSLPMYGDMVEYKGKFFIYNEAGSYFSADSGKTWTTEILGLPSNYIPSMVVHNGGLYCIGLSQENLYWNNKGWKIYQFNSSKNEFEDISANLFPDLPPWYPNHTTSACNYWGSFFTLSSDQKNLFLSVVDVGLYQFQPKNEIVLEPEDGNAEQLFFVYPNPSNGQFMIHYFNGDITGFSLSVKNELAQTVFNRKFNCNIASEMVDLSYFPKGVYFVQISGQNSSTVRKIIIQ